MSKELNKNNLKRVRKFFQTRKDAGHIVSDEAFSATDFDTLSFHYNKYIVRSIAEILLPQK